MKRKRNARWEDMNKNNIEFGQLIQHFEVFNYSEGKSPQTGEWYNQVLHLFLRWLQAEGKPTKLGAIGEPEVRDFILHLRSKNRYGKPTSTHTVATRSGASYSWQSEGY